MSQELQIQKQEAGELTLLQVIAQAAVDPRVEPEKLERLLAIQERIMDREAALAFNRDMQAIQAELPAIMKTAKGHNATYAKLEDIDRICQPFLNKYGFSVSYTSEPTPQGSIWRCIVSHVQGHREIFSTPPLPPDKGGSKTEVQAIFSTGSYGQRYSFCAAFKIVPRGMDDDGAASGFLDDEQSMRISDMLNDAGIKPGSDRMVKFLAYAESDSVSQIQRYRYESCMAMLRKAARK